MENDVPIPIVLVHGLIGSLSDSRIVGEFGAKTVYAPDLLGYGAHRDIDTSALTLADQADHVSAQIAAQGIERAHLVGRSVGGAVGVLVARAHPHRVASLVSVEGNFTLKDAFWSAQMAASPLAHVEAVLEEYRADPSAWIAQAGVAIDDWTAALARSWLANQPASTIRAQAAAVVAATRPTSYLEDVEALMRSALPVSLVAGARSGDGWDVPAWANALCAMRIDIENAGHLMMAESPARFAAAVRSAVAFVE